MLSCVLSCKSFVKGVFLYPRTSFVTLTYMKLFSLLFWPAYVYIVPLSIGLFSGLVSVEYTQYFF